MRCEIAQLALSARLDDAPDPRIDDELEEHLASCTDCQDFRARALRLRGAARREQVAAVPDLVDPIMTRVRSMQPKPASRFGPRAALVVAASMAAIAVIAVSVALNRAPAGGIRAEAIRLIRTRTLLAWTSGQVTSAFADTVAKLEGVESLTRVRSGVVWLDGWQDNELRSHQPPRGFRVPIELAAIDPATYARFVPLPEAETLSRIGRGEVILGSRGAALRDIVRTKPAAGAYLNVAEMRLSVSGRVDDAVIGAHEGVVDVGTGEALGLTRIRYLLVALDDGADVDTVAGRIRASSRNDAPVRVRALGETPYLRHGDAVLPQVRVKELFGEFAAAETSDGNLRVEPAWTERNIVTANLPVLGNVRCHRVVIPQLRNAMREIERAGLDSSIRADDYGGCFFPRYLSQDADAGISHHSWGIAFDVNVGSNAFGKPPQLDPRIVDIVERWGFTWGGRWLVPDGMHFECVRLVAQEADGS